MKAVIVDIKGKYAVAVDKEGQFIKLKRTEECRIGYEIDVPAKVIGFKKKTLLKVVSVAAALLLVSSISFAVYSYNLPYSYVNVDINPSLEIIINIYNRIIDIKALNPEGELLIEGSCRNSRLNEGVKKIIDNAVEQGFLKNNEENAVMLTVAGKDFDKVCKIREEVENTANKVLNDDNVVSEVIVENVVLEKREEAKELGISPGKLVLIEKLKEVKPEVTTDEYKDKPVKEIMKTIKDMKKGKEDNNLKDGGKDKAGSEPAREPLPGKKPDTGASPGMKESPVSPDAGGKTNKDNGSNKINNDVNKDVKDNKPNTNLRADNDINKDNKEGKINNDKKIENNTGKDSKDTKLNSDNKNNDVNKDNKDKSNNKLNNDSNKDSKDNKNNTNDNDKPNNQDSKEGNNKSNCFQYNPYWTPGWTPYWVPNWNQYPYWGDYKEKVEKDMEKHYREWYEKMGEEQKKQYNEWLKKMQEEQKKQYDEWNKKMEEQKKQYDEWNKKMEEQKKMYEENRGKEIKDGTKDGEKENKPEKPFEPRKDDINRKR
ncbi:MAG TPA: anti-sigma factor domain-containing protein [Acetivibrio sp.]|uniref:anti-sigma-I factor RsgI family protein n=1 Tax=Acetivibrio sp. TaxID=1872092 RepID=UPI002C0ACC47|nr:anti-sigma factor domain-containing protein [Acetivibrio sp.]HOM01594.1 anti-sigma factor domain-containing protein [Acetivibrio sp.]